MHASVTVRKKKKRTVKQMKLASYRWVSYCWAVRANHLVLKPDLKKVGIIMNKKYSEYNTMYDFMRSIKNLSKRASAYKNQSRNKKLSHRHSFSNAPINTKQRRKSRLQQPYVHTQLPIATCARKMKELTGKEVRVRQLSGEKRRKLIQLVTVLIKSADRPQQPYVRTPYVSTQLAIANKKMPASAFLVDQMKAVTHQQKTRTPACSLRWTPAYLL